MKSEKNIKVSIIVPAYKQEKNIIQDLENIDSVMSQTRWDYEIICVVDGFLDSTFEKASKINNPKIRTVGYETNKGKGYAVRYGMARTNGDFIAFIDGGMDINPNGISLILEHMLWYNADIIIASKRHPASKINYPIIRKIYSLGYQLLIKILFNLNIRDSQVGLKIFKREVLEKVLPRLMVKRFAFDIEILSVANYLGFKRIFEAPVEIDFDEVNSSFNSYLIFLNKNIMDMLIDTFAIFYRLKILRYYDDSSKRKWIYDKELQMRVNTGEMQS